MAGIGTGLGRNSWVSSQASSSPGQPETIRALGLVMRYFSRRVVLGDSGGDRRVRINARSIRALN